MAEDFDFIMNNSQPARNPLAGGSQKKRMLVALAGLALLLLVGLLFFSVVFGGGTSTKQALFPVVGIQTDIIDLTEIGEKELRSADLLNNTATTNLVVINHKNTAAKYLGEANEKDLIAYQNTGYQKDLEDAAQTGSFDKEYQKIFTEKLDLYKQSLITAYSQVDSTKLKVELERMHSEAKILSGEPSAPTEE